jgi:hypothetical protein
MLVEDLTQALDKRAVHNSVHSILVVELDWNKDLHSPVWGCLHTHSVFILTMVAKKCKGT